MPFNSGIPCTVSLLRGFSVQENKCFVVDATKGDGHAGEADNELAVLAIADVVAGLAAEDAGEDAYAGTAGEVAYRLIEVADGLGGELYGELEGCHLLSCDDCGVACGTVLDEVEVGEMLLQESLGLTDFTLQEDEAYWRYHALGLWVFVAFGKTKDC